MTSTTSHRIGAASGLAYFILVFGGNALATSGSTVDEHSSPTAVLADLRTHDTLAGSLGIGLELTGFLALLAFVAYLYRVLRGAEPRDGWLATAALSAGLLTLAVKVSSAAPMFAAVWRLDEIDAGTARTLVDINGAAFFLTWATTGALLVFAGLSALGSGALPRRAAALGLAIGVACLLTLPFGPEGPGVLPFLLSVLWLAAMSVVLIRRTTTEGAPQGALASVS
jgi:hypothetical protein